MVKCPNCGSTAQIHLKATHYNEDGWTIEVERYYLCGCGHTFIGKSYYHCQETYEITEPLTLKALQEHLYGRG